MTLAPSSPLTAVEARSVLAAEWASVNPRTPEEITEFYKHSQHMEADLEAFHADPERQRWTDMLVQVAQQIGAQIAVDIGCGAGHDLRALRSAGVKTVIGVEPNSRFRAALERDGFEIHSVLHWIPNPLEDADLLSCFDVLEHVPDPEQFLTSIATRAKIGAVLMEAVATHDTGTPLHLKQNYGWRSGRCLEQHGWERIGEAGRARIWQRTSTGTRQRTSVILCARRSVSLPTFRSILDLLSTGSPSGWRVTTGGEAGINRSRSIQASRWWNDTADDVFLMIDDDIVFEPVDAERLVSLCRNGYDIVCAAYPVRDATHLAMCGYGTTIEFAPDAEPIEIRYAATGFIAVHRRVLDALIPTLPLCHGNQPWAFWPLFDFRTIEDEASGGHAYLSEDWNFSAQARELGFRSWLAPSIKLDHLAEVRVNVTNMARIREASTWQG